MPMGISFPASVKNNTELNDGKPPLISGKLINLVAAKNLNKTNKWGHIKDKFVWVNVNFSSLEEIKKKQIIFVFHSKQLH